MRQEELEWENMLKEQNSLYNSHIVEERLSCMNNKKNPCQSFRNDCMMINFMSA